MSAVFNILVKIDAKAAKAGAQEVQGQLAQLSDVASATAGKMNAIWKAAGEVKDAIAGAMALVEAYQDIQNKLRVVTSGVNDLNHVSEQTLKISIATRTSWAATVAMFSRVSQNAGELGVGQAQLLNFTKQLNQAVVVSGATSVEAKAALTQLSQGLASGSLRGDELRSVMEQLPIVADVIAKKLGATRGQLRELGRAGKITSRLIIDAFAEAATDLDAKFGKTMPTLSQAMQAFGDTATEALGKIDKNLGVSRGITYLIDQLRQGVAVAGDFLSEAAKANPFGAAQQAVQAQLDAVAEADRIKKFEENLKKAGTKTDDVAKRVEQLNRVGVKLDFNKKIAAQVAELSTITNEAFGTTMPVAFEKTVRAVKEIDDAYEKLVAKEHAKEVAEQAEHLKESLTGIGKILQKQIEHWKDLADEIRELRKLTGKDETGAPGRSKVSPVKITGALKGIFPDVGNDDPNEPDLYVPQPVDYGAMEATKQNAQTLTKNTDDLAKKELEVANNADKYGKELTKIRQHTVDHEEAIKRVKDLWARKKITLEEYNREMERLLGKAKKLHEYLVYVPSPISGDNLMGEDGRSIDGPDRRENFRRRDQYIYDKETDLELDHIQALNDLNDESEHLNGELQANNKALEQQDQILKKLKGSKNDYILNVRIIQGLLAEERISLSDANKLLEEEYAIYVKSDPVLAQVKGHLVEHELAVTRIQHALEKENITKAESIRLLQAEAFAFSQAEDERIKAQKAAEDYAKYGKIDGKSMTTMREGIQGMRDDILNVGDDVTNMLKQSMGALDKFIIDAAESGKFHWEDMVQSMIHALNELAWALLKAAALKALLGLGTGGASGSAAAALAQISGNDGTDLGFGGGYARGGSYTVPGSGAPDSTLMAFRLTPGERIDFTPPGGNNAGPNAVEVHEYAILIAMIGAILSAVGAKSEDGDGKRPRRPQIRVALQQVTDRRDLLSVLDTRDGQAAVSDVARKNPGMYRSILKR